MKKARLHLRNRNRERYDLGALKAAIPALGKYIQPSKSGQESVDFSDPVAVKLLNQALLHHYYGIKKWDLPDENLSPPVPGRADYLHYAADLLSESFYGKIPKGDKVTCLDVGIGANCIYPIIGVVEYGWRFIGSDIDAKSIKVAKTIINANSILKNKIDCRLQSNSRAIFHGIIDPDERIDLTICNPPFHASVEEARKGTQRKVKNLTGEKEDRPSRNFGGVNKELIVEGGAFEFIRSIIGESRKYATNVFWFSTLVAKKSKLNKIYKVLEKTRATQVKTIPMGTGNKTSRIVAWTFLTKKEQKAWRETRWKTKVKKAKD